mmetsp:Transcript_12283/g.18488  ORF Transcript_12283/g.18488 Transcript_12283/m.18488 type:complete len:83 (-) Transcript_12283:932-1180(-)
MRNSPPVPNVIPNDFELFLQNTGLTDAMTALRDYATIPLCDRPFYSAIDFVLCSPSLLCWLSISMMDKCQVALRITVPSSLM